MYNWIPECHVQGSRAPNKRFPLGYQPDQCGLKCTLSFFLILLLVSSLLLFSSLEIERKKMQIWEILYLKERFCFMRERNRGEWGYTYILKPHHTFPKRLCGGIIWPFSNFEWDTANFRPLIDYRLVGNWNFKFWILFPLY